MVKVNKKIATVLFIIFLSLPINSHACACESVLSKAFDKIEEETIEQHIKPMNESLGDLIDKIEEETETLKQQNELLKTRIKIWTLKLLEAKELLSHIQKKSAIRKMNKNSFHLTNY